MTRASQCWHSTFCESHTDVLFQYLPELFTTWYEVSGTDYRGTSFMVENGAHTVQHIDPTVTFSAIVYGNADKESYGFAAGMRLARINAVSITLMVSMIVSPKSPPC